MLSILSSIHKIIKPDILKRFFQSCLDNLYGDYEHVISDDCSADSVMLEVLDWYLKTNPKARLLPRESEHKHLIFDVNKLIESAKGEWIWICDPDDEILPNAGLNIMSWIYNYGDKCDIIRMLEMWEFVDKNQTFLAPKTLQSLGKPTLITVREYFNAFYKKISDNLVTGTWHSHLVRRELFLQGTEKFKKFCFKSLEIGSLKINQRFFLPDDAVRMFINFDLAKRPILLVPTIVYKWYWYPKSTSHGLSDETNMYYTLRGYYAFLSYVPIEGSNFTKKSWYKLTITWMKYCGWDILEYPTKFNDVFDGDACEAYYEVLDKVKEYIKT